MLKVILKNNHQWELVTGWMWLIKRIKIKSNSVVLRNDSWKTGDTYHWGKQEIRSRFWFLEESGRPGLGMLLVRTWITQWDMFSLHVRREDCSSNRRRGLTYIDLRVLRFYIILKALMWQSESRSILSDSLWHHGLYSPWNSLGHNTSPGDFPNPGIKPRSPSLQVDSLSAEPQEKLKNTGVGSISILLQIFPTQ